MATNQKQQVLHLKLNKHTFELLAHNFGEQQDRVRDELFQVFGESDRWCTRNDLGQLKYLECCIKESLRLYPSVALFTRMTTEDVKIGR